MKKYHYFILLFIFLTISGCTKDTKEVNQININTGSIGSQYIDTGNYLYNDAILLNDSGTKIYNISGLPKRVRDLNISEPKLTGLQKDISFGYDIGNDKKISIVYYSQQSDIQRESKNLINFNNLIEGSFDKQYMGYTLENNKKFLEKLGIEENIYEKIKNDKFSFYSKNLIKENMEYTVDLRFSESKLILEIKANEIKPKNGNITLVPTGPEGNGPDSYCERMKLINEKGEELFLPEEIRQNCICEDIQIISPNNKLIFFNYLVVPDKFSKFAIYNTETNQTFNLGEEFIGIDGINCIRNDDSNYVACGVIDQEGLSRTLDSDTDTPYLSKFIVFNLDNNGKLLNKEELFQKKEETIDFICGDNCYVKDFEFGNNKTILYRGHEILSDGKSFFINHK